MDKSRLIPIIVDTDIGDDIDDSFTLCLAMASSEINLLGVTTVYKNTQARACIARRLLDLGGRHDIPVAAGESVPLKKMPMFGRTVNYDEEPISYRPEYDVELREPKNAKQLIISILEESPEPVAIVALGALTNIAKVLNERPDLKPKIRQLHIMGGAYFINWSEYNFVCDPEAADIVLNSGLQIKAVGIDVTRFCSLGKDEQDKLKGLDHPCMRMLWEMCARWNQSGIVTLHDPAALMSVFREDLFQFARKVYRVETQGKYTRGICVEMSDYNWKIAPDSARTYVSSWADSKAIVSECTERLLSFYQNG